MSVRFRKGTFITIPNKDHLHLLTATEIVVYLWLNSYSSKSGTCYPSRSLIAEKIKSNKSGDDNYISVKTVDRAIKSLEKFGFIKTIRNRKTKKGKLTSNIYYMMLLTTEISDEEESD